ncbi:MAG: hypothetical protein ACRD0L_04210 [Acidimicrobiales bacterium]
MATTADGNGYWLVDQLGDVATFGDASCHGSLTGVRLDAPVVGMAADLTTGGYWLAARDGGVFSFGAPFRGSMGDVHLSAPVVAISALPDGRGYRLAGADGAVYDFGAARYYGRATVGRASPPGPTAPRDNRAIGECLARQLLTQAVLPPGAHQTAPRHRASSPAHPSILPART